MTLTASQVTEWLVMNGYSKVDGRRTEEGGYLLNSPGEKHWSLLDYSGHGVSYISITPDASDVGSVDGSTLLELKLDASLQLRIEGNKVVGACVNEHYSGEAIAYAKQAPVSTNDLRVLLQACCDVFRQMVAAMATEGPPKSNEEIGLEVAEYLASNPQAQQLFTTPEEEGQ